MWRRHASLLAILAIGASSLAGSEYQLKEVLKPTKADRRILHNCPDYTTFFNNPKPLRSNSIVKTRDLLLGGTIEITSDITTNQIWTADNTYHIANDINVQALLVIEPGTVSKVCAGYDTGSQ